MNYLTGLKKTIIGIIKSHPQGLYIPQHERELVAALTVRAWVMMAHGVEKKDAVLRTCNPYHYSIVLFVMKLVDRLPPVSGYAQARGDFVEAETVESTLFTSDQLPSNVLSHWLKYGTKTLGVLPHTEEDLSRATYVMHPQFLPNYFPISLVHMTAQDSGQLTAVVPITPQRYLFSTIKKDKQGNIKSAVNLFAKLTV